MAFKHILVPYDKSEPAMRALEQAVTYAKENDGVRIDVICVTAITSATPSANYSSGMYSGDAQVIGIDAAIDQSEEQLKWLRDEVVGQIASAIAGVEQLVNVVIVPGMTPADDIVEYANANQCDLIVMGSRGLGALRGMLGSVSNGVLRNAPMPVLITK